MATFQYTNHLDFSVSARLGLAQLGICFTLMSNTRSFVGYTKGDEIEDKWQNQRHKEKEC